MIRKPKQLVLILVLIHLSLPITPTNRVKKRMPCSPEEEEEAWKKELMLPVRNIMMLLRNITNILRLLIMKHVKQEETENAPENAPENAITNAHAHAVTVTPNVDGHPNGDGVANVGANANVENRVAVVNPIKRNESNIIY
jgi:hypothetical protein